MRTNCNAITRLNLKKWAIPLKSSFCQDILGSSERTYNNQRCVGKGASFKYRHDLNSQWRIKICKTQAAIKAMIKCAHLNMSQLYIHASELSKIPVSSKYFSPVFEKPREKPSEYYIKVWQTKSGQICPSTWSMPITHTMTNAFKSGAILTSEPHDRLPRSATINWNTSSAEEVQKNTNSIQNKRLVFDKPCRHLAGFQLDKGQKFRSEMFEIC